MISIYFDLNIQFFDYYEAKLLSIVVHYIFESFFYMCSRHKQYWSKQSGANGSPEEKTIVSCIIPEFFEYMWCISKGSLDTMNIAWGMRSSWARYFYSTWTYAQTLYFFLTGMPKHCFDYPDAKEKHRNVFEIACKEYYTSKTISAIRN